MKAKHKVFIVIYCTYTLAENISDFFSQACRMQGILGVGAMMKVEALSQVLEGFLPFVVLRICSTCCLAFGHYVLACIYILFLR